MSLSRLAGLAACAALLAGVCYLPALGGSFISDDKALVAGNPGTASVAAALSAFVSPYWQGLKRVQPYYRPLPILSWALDRAVGGGSTLPFHLTNVALHAFCALLAGLLVAGLVPGPGSGPDSFTRTGHPVAPAAGAVLATALVAVQPLHTEPVAAIYGRPDLLAAAGALLFLNLAIRGHRTLSLLSLATALLSKESAVLLPLLVPFAFAAGASRHRAGTGGKRRRGHPVAVGAVAGAALLVAYAALRYAALGALTDPSAVSRLDNPIVGMEPAARWLTPIAVVWRLARLWLWPSALCADHGYDTIAPAFGPGDTLVLGGAALLLAAAGLTGWLAWRRSAWALPAAAGLLAWLPASNLIVLSPVLMAERLAYLPSIFVCVLAGGLFARLAAGRGATAGATPGWPFGRGGLHLMVVMAVIAMGARTFVRAKDFQSDLTLYGRDARSCPRSVKAAYNLGNALSRGGQPGEAAASFERAVSLAPWLGIAWSNLGSVRLQLGRMDEAEDAYRAAVEADPSLVTARASLAGILYLDGRLDAALEQARAALDLNPPEGDAAQLRELIARIRRRQSAPPPDAGP